MEFRSIARQGRAVAVVTCCLLMGSWTVQSCKDEYTLTGQPSWLGNSIYERLQEDGNYTTLLRLVDDLEQTEVLSHSGSKTLFAANDSAFQAWFGNNKWGVKNYSQLSTAKKKMLLNNTMINNPYLIELLSNVSGTPPLEGMCMRRETATTIYDSVEIISPDKMPATAAWQRFRDQRKSIPILKDATTPPMIHFLPKFMEYYNINSEDLAVLTNHQATSANEAWVNSRKVLERDITCKNGYIQRIDGVIEPMTNMAEVLRQHPQLSKWSELIDRFSAPYYNATATSEYNRLFNNEDSVYTMRYFSKRSAGGTALSENPDGEAVAALLTFDPGWNQYMYSNTMGYDLHYDAGAMIAPTNEALETWWNNEGKDLQMEYGSWENVPNATLAKLLNVNMLPTFTEAVPSKFERVLNDAKESLGIETRHIDSCFMACNGVVYMVNKVFSPAEYASVAYPALAHQSTMNVIYWAIDQLNFLPYLLSMDSRYSLLLPTNEALLWYLDPATYGGIDRLSGMKAPSALEFYYAYLYGFVTDRRKGSSYLMIPASTTEKFVSLLVNALVVIPVAFVAVQLGVDALLCLVDPTMEGTMAEGGYSVVSTLLEQLADEEDLLIVKSSVPLFVLLSILSFVFNYLYFLLCGMCFRKSKIVGAIAIVMGVTFVLSLCSGLFIGPLTDWAQNFDFEDAYSAQVFARGLLRGMTIVEALMVLGIGWGIFHRIKTLKH